LPAHRRLLDAVTAHRPDRAEAAAFALIGVARADIEDRIGGGMIKAVDVHA
jgi:DNA-binding GntR family transcriptional regulator